MPNIEEFLAHNRSMIIAPAGYGKTHTIVDCVKHCKESKKCLILTHTHAGVASIREKMKREGVKSLKYSLETISSFSLQYINAFHIDKNSIPRIENGNKYFNFTLETATKILQSKPIKDVIRSSYSHLIVDEYQDCTQQQHLFILALSNILPTHILGDPLQGIFGFRGNPLVNMESDVEMAGFNQNKQNLDTPWRWNNAGTAGLGHSLSMIRNSIMRQEAIDLSHYNQNIELVIAAENEYYQRNSIAHQVILREIKNCQTMSLLLIHPKSENIQPRQKTIQYFPAIKLIESIDDKGFYQYAKLFDEEQGVDLIKYILELMKSITLKSKISNWFRDDGVLKTKRNDSDKVIMNGLQMAITQLSQKKTSKNISFLIDKIYALPQNKCSRIEFLWDFRKSLDSSQSTGNTIYESMKKNRDFIRRQGRKVQGKCIGTTLLTKGLEFDTVIVLNAHKFTNFKHLYVALTRGCKKLIIITQNAILNLY